MASKQETVDSGVDETDEVKRQLEALKDDLASLTQAFKRLAGARGAEGLESLKGVAADAEARARQMSAEVERRVVERPVTSLLVAFGVGLVIGKLFERR